jgi:type II secretory ATPase GspE/PulE/Tfp pilus assembly ATPase PilB-like protein
MNSLEARFAAQASQIRRTPERYAVEMVELILSSARQARASDIHLLPQSDSQLAMLWRIDGVLQPVATFDYLPTNLIARLKVLSQLLTYRTDIPQEGRIQTGTAEFETRVSTFPTLHGEKAVVRLFVASGQFLYLEDLAYSPAITAGLRELLARKWGLLVIAGPAGSGKTTSLYALLRTLLRDAAAPQSICTLEDPIEALLPGVAQSQVRAGSEFTYQKGLASLMRQDPDVIMVGEIRDRETAQTVFQASLTGLFVATSFHAGNTAEAISRVADMGIEPYVIRSGLAGILAQRLLRKRCDCSATTTVPRGAGSSLPCPRCLGQGYAGRVVIGEYLGPELPQLGPAILARAAAPELHTLACQCGMQPLLQAATNAIRDGLTTAPEVYRVLGAWPDSDQLLSD